ncbi:ribulose 1,5-bisphosphate carboxylase large subunit [Candidatus Micrarchaeota archaeon]|nr:ribulose 1,5-bisphosphate carboxylase large subunit [Candidatus Micrarchaeota archaeon]
MKPEDLFFTKAMDEDEYIIARYYVESPLGLKRGAEEIGKEESTGTWTSVPRERRIHKLYAARIIKLDYKNSISDIGFPIENFSWDVGGIPQLMSTIAGNLFGLEKLKNVRLLDVHLPKSVVREFKGPRLGVEGLRKIIGTEINRRAHVGTIIKPKIGLPPKEQAEVFYEAASGGIDCGKDDETLSNQRFSPLLERAQAIREVVDKVKSETGRRVLYAINVTNRCDKLLETVDSAAENGATLLMIDAVCVGLNGIQAIAEANNHLPLLVHRAGHAAFDRNPRHGINNMVIAKLSRLCGGDLIHTGAIGKMHGEVLEIRAYNDFLRREWFHIRKSMPVASGGLHPGLVEKNIKLLGSDLQLQAGGGIHSHPKGTRAGAAAMRQAVEAVNHRIPLNEYAKTHSELKAALKKWGYVR